MTYEEYTEKYNQLMDLYERIDNGFVKNDIKNEIISLRKEYFGLNWKEKIIMLKFDIERAKEVYRCDKKQYNENSLLTAL